MQPIPRKAFQQITGFEAKKHHMRQTNDGLWQLTLTVDDFSNADWLLLAPPGTPLAIGLKALDYDGPPSLADNPQRAYVARAAMYCRDPAFQDYIIRQSAIAPDSTKSREELASAALRQMLGLESRADLARPGYDAARTQFTTLLDNFKRVKSS